MAERDIVSIVWHQKGDQVDLHYLEGEPDRLVGAVAVVADLAASVGLTIVPSPPGTKQWVRDPESETERPPDN
jgi:hypothetical protein